MCTGNTIFDMLAGSIFGEKKKRKIAVQVLNILQSSFLRDENIDAEVSKPHAECTGDNTLSVTVSNVPVLAIAILHKKNFFF